MLRRWTRVAVLAGGLLTVSATPAFADNTLVVAPRKASFGCAAQEQFTTISAAVAAASPGSTILVCPGTYQETVTVNKPGLTLRSQQPLQATIKAPHAPITAIVRITSSNVSLNGFTITNSGQTSSPNSIQYGVYVSNGGSADIEHNDISDISDAPISGDQNGVAVEVGHAADNTTGSATIADNTIEDYQKNGVTVDGVNSWGDIEQNTIMGVGPTSVTAQNGIQISSGASGVIKNNTVSNNVYSPGTVTSTGILLCGAAFTDTEGNTLSTDDTGLYDAANEAGEGCPAAQKSKATMRNNTIIASTFDGLVLDTENGAQSQGDQAVGTWGHTAYGADQGDGFDVFQTTNSLLIGDTASGNSEDGFHNESGSTGNTYKGDAASANLVYDCEDDSTGSGTAGTANTWQQDLGDINQPPLICSMGNYYSGHSEKAHSLSVPESQASPSRPEPSPYA